MESFKFIGFLFLDFAEKVPEDVREQVLMTNILPCVKVCGHRFQMCRL